MNIGIIGAGMAGIQVLGAYLKNKFDTLTIFDVPKYAGTGHPFLRDHEALLLNQPKDLMCLDEEEDYIHWLKQNHPEEIKARFTTRSLFGAYSKAIFEKYIAHPKVNFVPLRVSEIGLKDGKWQVRDQEKTPYIFDGIHLCIGQLPYQDPYGLKQKKGFIPNPYPIAKHKKAWLKKSHLALLGTGLSTVDVALFLDHIGYEGTLSYLSRSGLFPMVRGDEIKVSTPHMNRLLKTGHHGLKDILSALQKDMRENGVTCKRFLPEEGADPAQTFSFQLGHLKELGIIQQVVLKHKEAYPLLWHNLSRGDQRLFLNHYEDIFKMIQSPMPPESAQVLLKSFQKKKGSVYRDIQEIVATDEGFEIRREKKASIQAPLLINTTGPGTYDSPLSHSNEALLLARSLFESRLLEYNAFGSVLVRYPDFSLVSQKHGCLPNFKIHGQLISGVHFGNNSIEQIGIGARQGVLDMISFLDKNASI